MVEIPFLTSQKNEIFNLIKWLRFNPSNFKWLEVRSVHDPKIEVYRLKFAATEFFFQFDVDKGERYCVYSPGEDKIINVRASTSWDGQKQCFRDWLTYLRRELQEPDLWEELSKYQLRPDSELEPDIPNDPFSPKQIEQILSGLNKIKQYIKEEVKASKEQFKSVSDRIDYLGEALRRQGRRDWMNICIGVFIQIVVQLALSPEQTKSLWSLVKSAVEGIIKFLPK